MNPISDKRGPESEIADERSATGRAEGGSIPPRRDLAQWLRIYTFAPRGAPLPLIISGAGRRAAAKAPQRACA